MADFPNSGAPMWGASQASPWAPVNEAGYIWDAFASRSIIEDRDLTAPPGSCANGARYLIDTPATGLWAGHEGELAIAIGANASNGWHFADVANHGNQLFVRDEDLLIEYDGAAWITAPVGVSSMNDLTDVTETAPANNDMLRHNGTNYVNDVKRSTDGTFAGNSDSNLPSEKAVKTYVDGKLAGLSWKQAVRAATVAALTLATDLENGDSLDGVTLATGDRVLVKNQSTGSENGIYIVNASGAPTRATDADSGAELVNASVYVSEGTVNADTQWTCSTNAPITVGSTSLTFAQFTGGVLSAAADTDIWTGTSTTKAITPDALFDSAKFQTLTDGATITPDFGAGINFKVTLGGNRTLANPTNAKEGQSGVIRVIQDGTGGWTLAYGSNWRFPGGAAANLLSTAAGSIDIISYIVDESGLIHATLAKAFAA